MPIEYCRWITRELVRSEPETLWIFGDNMVRRGLGGQAKEMRGEPNAVGLPTKWKPDNNKNSFFTDDDLPEVIGETQWDRQTVYNHLLGYQLVVWPEAGIGTGLASLASHAPLIAEFYEDWLGCLIEEFGLVPNESR